MNQESPDADLERMLRSHFAQKIRQPADFERFWTAVDATLDAKPDIEIKAPLLIEAEQCGASNSTTPEPFGLEDDDTYAFVLEDTLEESMTNGHDQREQEPSRTARSTRWDARRRSLGPRGTAVAGIAEALILVIIAATIFTQIAIKRTPHPAATATPSAFTRVTLPNANVSQITQAASAPDGSLRYAAVIPHGAVIGHVTPDETITEFPVPTDDKVNDVYIGGMAVGSDGAVWFSSYESSNVASAQFIRRMTPNGAFTMIQVPDGLNLGPFLSGPDNELWFIGNRDLHPGASSPRTYERVLGEIAADGHITQYPFAKSARVPTSAGGLKSLCVGPDKAIWYTVLDQVGTDLTHLKGRIVRMSLSGQAQEFPVPYAPNSITAGADGALWYSEYVGPIADPNGPPPPRKGFIGRMTTAGVTSELPIDPSMGIDRVIGGSDGAIRVTIAQDEVGKFGRITPNGEVKTFTTGGNSGIFLIAPAPGALWLLDGNSTVWRYRLAA